MSEFTEVNKTQNQAHFNYDVSKIFVWNNRYRKDTLLNNSGGQKSFLPGTVLGRVSASGKLVPMASGAVDGSQTPIGVLKTQVDDLADTAEADVNMCYDGDVVEAKIILDGADTLDTLVGGRTIRDLLIANSAGIKLVESQELTGFDNQ